MQSSVIFRHFTPITPPLPPQKISNQDFTMFFLLNRVGAGHMVAGCGRSVPPPALDTGEKVCISKQI